MSDEESSGTSDSEQEKKLAAHKKASAAATSAAAKKKGKKGSSESEDDDESEDEKEQTKGKPTQAAKPKSKYAHTDSESEEEDTANKGRSMKSAQEKALDSISKASRELRVSLNGDDWPKTKELFESLNKLLAKHEKSLPGGNTPEAYLEAMVALESEVNRIAEDKDLQKKLSHARYKSYSAIKSRLAKHLEPYRAAMAALPEKEPEENNDEEAAPKEEEEEDDEIVSSSESEESSSESSDESESGSGSDDSEDEGEESESSDYESESDSPSSEEDDEVRGKLTGRAKWVKQAVLETGKRPPIGKDAANAQAQVAGDKRLKKLVAAQQRRQQKIEEERERRAREAAVVLTSRDVERLIKATASKLWKRDSNKRELIELLRGHVSRGIPFGPRIVLPGLMLLASAQFETRSIDDCMSLERWRSALSDLNYILRILAMNPDLRLAPLAADETMDTSGGGGANAETVDQILAEATKASQGDALTIQAREKALAAVSEAEAKRREENPNVVFVIGDIAVFATRLATELYKALRITPPHSSEFLERLSDESLMLELAATVQEYLERIGEPNNASKQALLRIELMYYKHDTIAIPAYQARMRHRLFGNVNHPAAVTGTWVAGEVVEDAQGDATKSSPASWPVPVDVPPLDTAELIEQLCLFIYREGDDSSKNRAMLCQIYHLALHDKFHKARDLLLMSHLQENIQDADVEMQILFNRVMAQLGLCAFRIGLMQFAHGCLQEVCSHGRAKELLAQGISWRKQNERDLERENLERRRLVPYHMHLDLDLLECSHLTSAMLLEVTNLASQDSKPLMHDDRHGRNQQDVVISKAFRKYLDQYERNVFTGPPENIRDHIMAAVVALRESDWRAACDNIIALSVWDAVPNSFAIKDMLRIKIKSEALRVYLLTFAAYYETMRFDSLCDLFELDKATVKNVLSKLILARTLHASWDHEVIRLHKLVPTNLQALCIQLSEKTRDLVDSNERLFERLTGGSGDKRNDRSMDKREDGERRPWKGGRGGGGGGYNNPNNRSDQRRGGGGNRNPGQGGGGGGQSHMVQRGYRGDRSRTGASGQGGGANSSQW